jgi:polysaccharide export outer membrane protein
MKNNGVSVMKMLCRMLILPPLGLAMLAPMSAAAQAAQPATPAPAPAAQAAAPPAPSSKPAVPVAAPPASAEAKGATMVDPSNYVIGAEDSLQVTVWREPTLSGVIPVRPDGMISLVLVGDVPAAGLTPMQLSADISNRLKKYIQDPSVSVVVTAVNSQRIFVIGEVGKVGPLMLSPGMTPLQAISAAGGLGTFANSKRIYILRGAQGKQTKIPFNYKQALKGDSKQLITLLPGDTIVVP